MFFVVWEWGASGEVSYPVSLRIVPDSVDISTELAGEPGSVVSSDDLGLPGSLKSWLVAVVGLVNALMALLTFWERVCKLLRKVR